MKQFVRLVAGEQVTINVVESEDDLDGFRNFIRANLRILGCDSETTGLDIFSDTFKCRLVQFGTDIESWVVPVEHGGKFLGDVLTALKAVGKLIFQNAAYDLQVFDRCFGLRMEELWPKVVDTKILAHLVDPRGKQEGGAGHSLEDLTRKHIDAGVADSVKTLMKTLATDTKGKVGDIWKTVGLDHPDYLLYAGMDPILAARLYSKLLPLVPTVSKNLIVFEHQLAEVCAIMERTGFLLDVEYAKNLAESLHCTELDYTWKAGQMGCENVNSTDQVAHVLESRGVKITGRTPTGRKKVDKVLLDRLVDEGDEFAHAVVEAKKSRKWRTTWVDGFLSQADSQSRCHASINPLRARTARMSITGIPAQTLPAGDWLVRRCFVADPGQVMVSVDYQAQELRVLAGLSGDPTMQRAFTDGDDLHQITADASGVSRKIGKMTNFLTVYGGGAKNLAQQADIDLDLAKKVIAGFGNAYPKVKELSRKLQRDASMKGYVVTPSGRVLPVDENRPYAALNYMVQSSSRDITAGGLIRLHKAGFTPYLRLPIHDEILASVPDDKSAWGAFKIADLMSTEFRGVHVGADPEVGGKSWGSLYGSDY